MKQLRLKKNGKAPRIGLWVNTYLKYINKL